MVTFFGFTIDSTLLRIIYVTVALLGTLIVHKIVIVLINRRLQKTNRRVKIDDTQFMVLKRLISVMIYIAGIAVAISFIPSLRTVAVSLFAGAGVLAIVVGFAAQQAFSNIINGIFIAVYKPFRVGDIISFSGKTGVVEDINLRHTVIRNFENKRFVAPNSILGNEIVENYNIGEEKTCRHVEIGISYDSDIDKAMKIMAEEIEAHSLSIDPRTKMDIKEGKPKTLVKVLGFGDSSVKLRAWAWAKNPSDAFMMGCDVNKSIKERFDKEGIEIPFPYRTVVYKKDL
ncbi:MAG: mechanosensitive ion channel family protein [Candidatus Woesearchaeota archaeon]